MKRAAKLLSVAAGAVIFSLLGSTALAVSAAHGQGGAHFGGGHGVGFSGGNRDGFHGGSFGSFHGGSFCGVNGGVRCGYYGGYRRCYGSWGGCYGLNSYCNSGYSAPYYGSTYYYPGPAAYDPPAPEDYSPQPVAYVPPQPVVYNFPSQDAESSQHSLPTVIRGTTLESASPQAQSSPGRQYSPQRQLLGVAEVKALTKAGLGEELIINQIRTSGVEYHLTGAEIIDLKQSGVTENVINAMINTAPAGSAAKDVRFKLTGIVGEPRSGFLAVINNQTVAENGYVDGATVKRIDRDHVSLDLNGHEVVATLH